MSIVKSSSQVNKVVIAAFDFDGTISYRDSLLPFLFFTHGYFRAFINFIVCLPTLCGYVLGIRSRQQTKEALLKKFYKGLNISDLRIKGERYVAHGIKVKPEALERIRWHQQQGHRCIIVSASIDAYLEPWAKKMGFSDVLCSKVATDENGFVTGKLQGLNCRALEKVRQIEKLLGPKEEYILYAYGDSRGDKEMLDLADYRFYRTFKP